MAVLRRAVSSALSHAGSRDDRDDADVPFAAVLREAVAGRLTGFLAAASDRGVVPLGPEQRTRVAATHGQAVLRVLELEHTLVHVHRTLADRGIDLRVLKGPAVARTVYPEPHVRTFIDIDVLVPAQQWSPAVAALTAVGYRRLRPELRAGFDERFAKTVTMQDERGRQVDLHRTLVVGPYGPLIRTADLGRSSREIEVAGIRMRALGPEEQFLNVCYHAALGDAPPRLSALFDVAYSLLHDDLDVTRVRALARRWQGEAVLARALQLAWDTLAPDVTPPLVRWACTYRTGLRDRVLLASYGSNAGNAHLYLATLLVLPGVARRLAFLRGLLLPTSVEGAQRRHGHLSWWLHGLRGLAVWPRHHSGSGRG